jgi:hypothetical protein
VHDPAATSANAKAPSAPLSPPRQWEQRSDYLAAFPEAIPGARDVASTPARRATRALPRVGGATLK